jgi:hypothetical protein
MSRRALDESVGCSGQMRVFPRKLSGYKNLDILGPYAILENIKENDFCEKPARFEDKVRDVVAPVHRDQ